MTIPHLTNEVLRRNFASFSGTYIRPQKYHICNDKENLWSCKQDCKA